jgi:hypothetical protein
MMKSFNHIFLLVLILALFNSCENKSNKLKKSITKANYVEAETDNYFSQLQKEQDVNTFKHNPAVSKDKQEVIRSNRDVMYSLAVVDISEGATFTVPPRDAFQIIHIMDENHLSHFVVKAGESKTITKKDVTGGTHVYLLARTKITENMEESLAAQRALKIEAKSSNPYISKGYNEEELIAFRNKLTSEFIKGDVQIIEHKSFGNTLKDVDSTSYIYAAAVGWGGLPSHTAQYLPTVNGQGKTNCQKFIMPKPDLDWDNGAFFSLTTYDKDGWIVEDNFYVDHPKMETNDENYTIYINCPDKENSIKVQEGWTGVFRFYLPNNELEFIEFIDSIRDIKVIENN